MLVNKSNLTAVFITLKTTFNKAFEAAPSIWEKTTMKVPSGSSQNDYTWLSRFPKMIKWLGSKTVKALKAFTYTVVNDDYEATVEVDRNDIDAELKNDAFINLCFDGQYFYDTDHVVAGASVSNKGTAALSAATKALVAASYGAGRLAIMNFKDDEGRPLGLIPNLLEVGPALEATAKLICNNKKLEDDKPNPYVGTAEVVVNPRLTSSTQWMLHVTNRPLKPYIYQERKAPAFVQQTNPDTEDVFMRKKFKFGAEARAAGGYGLWQLSYGSTGGG
jgi:phage major head subunit gpT-like protein